MPATVSNEDAMPTVSFIVPCYKLAHLLPECVDSILEQTYRDFEIIILDDCSPDDTPAVAARFSDPRVRYVRNPQNLGHLRNYNKGIELSRGEYVWLISADDRLRRPYVLERYLTLAERHPEIGFVFCSGIGLRGGQEEAEVIQNPYGADAVLDGRRFLFEKLLEHNWVLAASGMVRRSLYEKLGAFPLDLPYAGDWYLWCLFSLHADVGYLAEPMVNYRDHDLNMTKILSAENWLPLIAEEFTVHWRIGHAIEAARHEWLLDKFHEVIVGRYAHYLVGGHEHPGTLTPDEVERSIERQTSAEVARQLVLRSYVLGGDLALQRNDRRRAAELLSLIHI